MIVDVNDEYESRFFLSSTKLIILCRFLAINFTIFLILQSFSIKFD